MPTALAQKRTEDPDTTAFQEYRGIQLGMAADEVRKKLGNPTDKVMSRISSCSTTPKARKFSMTKPRR